MFALSGLYFLPLLEVGKKKKKVRLVCSGEEIRNHLMLT